ncbi:MAG: DUF89 family protein [Phycisphaerales bacterium]|nr:DUF89 family protein [Phycisphaerales bacterium]
MALYRRNFPRLLEEARAEANQRDQSPALTDAQITAARNHLFAFLDMIEADCQSLGRVDILRISMEREVALRQAGIADPYRWAKEKETATSLKLLPQVLAEIDALPSPQRAERVVRGILAGNLFDLNAAGAAALFQKGELDFRATLAKLKPRPWVVDNLDLWINRLHQGPCYQQALLFLDNAGSDAILGMIPFARDLLSRGIPVILSANTSPSLNDITHSELVPIIGHIAGFDATIAQSLQTGQLRLIASGNPAPLIDLTQLSTELVDAAAGADLVVLEGMGRALESNWLAEFSCDVIRTAMIKDGGVAWVFGWDLYDLVLRFDPRK